MWVTANFKETQLAGIVPGQAVHVIVDAMPNHPLVGRVDSFSPASGNQFALLPAEAVDDDVLDDPQDAAQ